MGCDVCIGLAMRRKLRVNHGVMLRSASSNCCPGRLHSAGVA